MARVISVFLPMWPIDRRQRQAGVTSPSGEGPLIIAGRVGNRRVITAACPAARDLGLRVGMTVSRAQALVPDLRIEADDASADAAALERLALWLLQRVAPIVLADPPDGIVIDSTGADHLHGGEAAMLEALAGKLALSGITARLALADSWGAAHALARCGTEGVIVVPPGASDATLAPLPLEALRLPAATVVTNDVLFHTPDRRILQDVVTAIRHNTTVDALGFRRERHADRYLKTPVEMHRLFTRYPEALARSARIAEACRFSLDELEYQYPEERDNPTVTAQATLERLTWEGAAARYPEGVPTEVTASLQHELRLIDRLRKRSGRCTPRSGSWPSPTIFCHESSSRGPASEAWDD